MVPLLSQARVMMELNSGSQGTGERELLQGQRTPLLSKILQPCNLIIGIVKARDRLLYSHVSLLLCSTIESPGTTALYALRLVAARRKRSVSIDSYRQFRLCCPAGFLSLLQRPPHRQHHFFSLTDLNGRSNLMESCPF